jgi:hypothetical protein
MSNVQRPKSAGEPRDRYGRLTQVQIVYKDTDLGRWTLDIGHWTLEITKHRSPPQQHADTSTFRVGGDNVGFRVSVQVGDC